MLYQMQFHLFFAVFDISDEFGRCPVGVASDVVRNAGFERRCCAAEYAQLLRQRLAAVVGEAGADDSAETQPPVTNVRAKQKGRD